MTLNQLKIGEKCIIDKLNLNNSMKRRMLDIGLIEGTKVECVLESPFKEPKAYLIRGTLMAIREQDSKNIKVVKYEDSFSR